MADSIDEQLLREVEAYPSTNVTRLFRFAGRVLPDTIGGGCLWLAAKMGGRLLERIPGLKVRYYDLGAPGSHTTTLSDDGRERKLFEPSLFQVRPYVLNRLTADPQDCYSDTFPMEGGYTIRLKYTWVKPEEMLKMEMLSPRGYTLREYLYRFQAPIAANPDDPYAGLPFLDQQDTIYVHVLNPDYTKTMLTLGTRTRRMNIGRQSDKLYIESEPGFQGRFEHVAKQMQVTEKQLRDLLGEALEIHNGHYPLT